MSASNGVIRVGRKGKKKFAFGEEGVPFEVDVVIAFQEWVCVDEGFREGYEDRSIPAGDMAAYHQAAVNFAKMLSLGVNERGIDTPAADITTAEALDFIARLRECYDEVADFFLPKSREARLARYFGGGITILGGGTGDRELTRFDEDVLEKAMDGVQAWEHLNDPEYCTGLDMVGFRSLLIRAGYPPDAVRKAALERGWDRLSRSETV